MEFIYNGKHSINIKIGDTVYNTWNDLHLIPISKPIITPSDPALNIVDIKSRFNYLDLSGIQIGKPIYGLRTGELEFIIDHNKWGTWYEAYNYILSLFNGKKAEIVLTDMPSITYKGRLEIAGYSSDDEYSTISIGYNLYNRDIPESMDLTNMDTDSIRYIDGPSGTIGITGGGLIIYYDEVPPEIDPGGDTPGGDTPGGDTPGGDTPGGDSQTEAYFETDPFPMDADTDSSWTLVKSWYGSVPKETVHVYNKNSEDPVEIYSNLDSGIAIKPKSNSNYIQFFINAYSRYNRDTYCSHYKYKTSDGYNYSNQYYLDTSNRYTYNGMGYYRHSKSIKLTNMVQCTPYIGVRDPYIAYEEEGSYVSLFIYIKNTNTMLA